MGLRSLLRAISYQAIESAYAVFSLKDAPPSRTVTCLVISASPDAWLGRGLAGEQEGLADGVSGLDRAVSLRRLSQREGLADQRVDPGGGEVSQDSAG